MQDDTPDLYSVLGVLPEAEDVVITAAYRALAQRYHPDRWRGEPAEAHRRMSELNAAYEVLSHSQRRADYDKGRRRNEQASFSTSESQADAFAEALAAIEDRWKVACEVFPDLSMCRERLNRISTSLAFAYVSTLLDSKRFADRADLATRMERVFLERYFSQSDVLVAYARRLIAWGQRDAAKYLNQLIDVVGAGQDAGKLIELVETRFDLKQLWKKVEHEEAEKELRSRLTRELLRNSTFNSAKRLAEHLGYVVVEKGQGLFKPSLVTVTSGAKSMKFDSPDFFITWARETLCSQ